LHINNKGLTLYRYKYTPINQKKQAYFAGLKTVKPLPISLFYHNETRQGLIIRIRRIGLSAG
jgi:hypothetical protein